MFDLMLKPFIECLILVGIHAYLGLHVIRRRVIFVDLALAQIAALGTIVGGILGLMDGTATAMLYSLSFCMVGAALFAFTRVRHDRIPHEAVIGLVYIVAFATAVLIVQKTEGVEHMEGILVGNLLFVRWSDIIAAGATYAAIGAFHLVFWKKFLLISDTPEKAFESGINVRLWDFLFYASFGFVITFSTRVAGVLLVFVFLVAPAIMALMITARFGRQLAIGCVAGTVVVVAGLFLSVYMEPSPGPTVVAFYAIVLAAMAVVVYVVRSSHWPRALVHAVVGIASVGVIGGGIYLEGKALAGLGESESGVHGHAHMAKAAEPAPAEVERKVDAGDKSISVLRAATGGCVGNGKLVKYARLPDFFEKLEYIENLAAKSERKALGFLLILLSDPDATGYYRSEAIEHLKKITRDDYGYDPEQDPAANAQALAKLCEHLKEMKRNETGP